MNKGSLALLLTLVLIFLASQTIVIVRDTEKAILLKLGAFERTIEPGLSFKIPFIDDVMKFEARLRTLDTQPDRVLSEESKPLFVDSYDRNRHTGSIILIDEQTNETIGAGMILNKS